MITRYALLLALPLLTAPAVAQAQDSYPKVTDEGVIGAPGEDPVDPYTMSNANAGATPYADDDLFHAFHGKEGISRIVEDFVTSNVNDPRIGPIFKPFNLARTRRTLKEQFCYLLGGPCDYSGRSMKDTHKYQGINAMEFNRVVENLQKAMSKEGVSFRAQNKLLAKLAPMFDDVVER
jgi:hemoglobin